MSVTFQKIDIVPSQTSLKYLCYGFTFFPVDTVFKAELNIFQPTKADIPTAQEGHSSFSELNYERDLRILLMEIPLNPQNYIVSTL